MGGIQKVLRLQAHLCQFLGRQIAAPLGQVPGKVPENVDQLETLAEPDAILDQRRFVERRPGKNRPSTKAGPELAHAAGHPVGVVVEFPGVRERFQPR